ncbi:MULTISPECIES: tRNA uridine-5-carboxymethylaminomethyl(34) synthesis GTPase MnmE [unclassified Tolypothrix]|uniref:tRNA uridine-5-carboxymethylaminomethyl(34) synthesis GTPase MnmE n=1 Tax=unclassified Tolypothrix TaxID=2649714 RepID=UPI0005EAAD21|nr:MULTISPECIES: tRNA uridine-5-carboxymethylaminomethyl(34) synthesis GTPase MnmE [unclassified Tolypothrix]BAY93096.1 tRNA modification GTPase TrmE [Microchaete diplosiphon NIES-3275]EKF00343.1 tRNA modification GTP binding protein [Tolypothrix sp. PCC 7601]MBE9081883.1 tRNA uridine-5-carboxymethylaminomethyl(34) synthesis GTPase MnmE [Tolypothrix sp. LEGE 11397]UYD26975.1 tRNA uridine-5-carboxymethylaminomethyl(34) synthesis GTPase MnmE [Tolypothrix sp. PCC 7712]UYD37166.1 tRNA uridine-5-ca
MSEVFATTGTIAAIATAVVPQQGSVGIVRVSGSQAIAIAQILFHAPGRQVWESHRILYGYIRHPQSKKLVDEALLLIMQAPRSYTREDVVEFHCHGGIMAVQQVLQLCLENGARLAQPGEFTLRAFLNGRLDLTQAEGIADLVGARSPQAAQTALAGLQGKLAHPIRQLRANCLDILAEIEARIDFEEDLPPLDDKVIISAIDGIAAEISQLLATKDKGELLRTGLKVAIVGRPNVGKSSLLNAWSRSDRAIVTDLPGTTRDVVESQLVVGGIPVQVLDTAGIRETEDQVEKIGVERSRRAASAADLVLLTIDASTGWTTGDAEIYEQVQHRPLILVINKIDLVADIGNHLQSQIPNIKSQIFTAAAQNKGIEDLETAILEIVKAGKVQAADMDLAINQRQAASLTKAKISLEQMQATITQKLPLDFWTIDLRDAIHALGEITGEEVTESVLDRIFSKFCIGK